MRLLVLLPIPRTKHPRPPPPVSLQNHTNGAQTAHVTNPDEYKQPGFARAGSTRPQPAGNRVFGPKVRAFGPSLGTHKQSKTTW